MYHGEAGAGPRALQPVLDAQARRQVPRTVVLIGVVSLLTDISSEMVVSVLPIYLFVVLRLSPLEYGWIDGLFNGSAALVRLLFAYWADRTRHHKRFALAGYAMSAASRLGLFVAGLGGWISVAVVLLLDRIGKGIRTAPRDAMIAQASDPARLGASFGMHRALDALGALIGPLVATGLLLWLPGRFDAVFAVSVLFAMAGLVVLGRWVPGSAEAPSAAPPADAPPSVRLGLWRSVRAVTTPPFIALCASCSVLGAFTVSDSMVYLGLQQKAAFASAYLPMMFVATAGVFMLLAMPLGRLADRMGPMRLFLAGHVGLALMYTIVGLDFLPPAAAPALVVLLLGLYYAATDGVIMALLARRLPAPVLATGMALMTSVISLARMVASVLFGWAWTEWSHDVAMGLFAGGMLVSLALTLVVARRWWRAPGAEQERREWK